ncbi:hypothetical protein [Cohnella luojiensis]|uniref:Uncharacterized protein n=1 Tax=Cohnella luojiensis TaxID=652876 RepID=A0A4Y8LNP0_9BACL|nr:hypothetical protein [Cohnella luojiensis]TFE22618.1 hypothetical protein E2980_21345 [Cohnella luojiensis]
MERFLVDFIVNIFETIAGISLILSIFRFQIKGFVPQILFTAVVMAQTSYLLREVLNQDSITPFFMLAWIVILLWLLFRVHYFYALLMAITGYLGYLLIQISIVYSFQFLFDTEIPVVDFYTMKIIQIISSSIALLISVVLMMKRIGFSFVPDRVQESVLLKGTNRRMLLLLIAGSVIVSAIVFIYESGFGTFMLGILTIVFALYAIIHLALAKERSI